MRHALRLAAALLAVCFLVGCATPLADIRARPDEFRGKTVTVSGTVGEGLDLPVGRFGYYQLRDETGEIWVQTTEPVPAEGTSLRVSGVVAPGLKVAGLELGLVLEERRRR